MPETPDTRPAIRDVLVVDDLPDWGPFFRSVFRRVHHVDVRVTSEVSGLRAIEMIRSHPFDVVVSDFRMRDADGIAVLTAAQEANPDGFRVLMSSYSEIPRPIGAIQRAQIDAYLRKPLDPADALLALLPFLDRSTSGIAESRAEARGLEAIAEEEERPASGA